MNEQTGDFVKIRMFRVKMSQILQEKSLVLKDCITSFLHGVSSLSIVFDFWFESVIVSLCDFVLLKTLLLLPLHTITELGRFLLPLLVSCTHPLILLCFLFLPCETLFDCTFIKVGVFSSSTLGTVFVATIFNWFHPLLSHILQTLFMNLFTRMFHLFSILSPLAQQSTIHLSQTLPFQYPGSSSSSSSYHTSSEHCGGLNSPITIQNRTRSSFFVVNFCYGSQPCVR